MRTYRTLIPCWLVYKTPEGNLETQPLEIHRDGTPVSLNLGKNDIVQIVPAGFRTFMHYSQSGDADRHWEQQGLVVPESQLKIWE